VRILAGRRQAIVPTALALICLLPACDVATCDTEPFAGAVVATIRPPVGVPDGVSLAACVSLVSFDGIDYELNGNDWEIPEDALQEIGAATGANAAAGPIDDPRVFALTGVEPPDGIVMRIGPDGAPVLLVPRFESVPPSACPYLADARIPCGDGA
jgi:hypothetical protein